MIVLDLQSEQFPQYEKFQSYFGQPFIWCMLHNFGGTLGMFGSSGIINKVYLTTFKKLLLKSIFLIKFSDRLTSK
jgi:hypothetical protein